MATEYSIEFTETAKNHLCQFSKRNRVLILTKIDEQLKFEPDKETKNRKRLRQNPFCTWELRIDRYRVFYDVFDDLIQVLVLAIGEKERNRLIIGGEEIRL